MAKIPFFTLFSSIPILFPFSLAFDSCELQAVKTCDSPADVKCIENLLTGLNEFYDFDAAVGYFVSQFDPLTVRKIKIDAGNGYTLTLNDVIISGNEEVTVEILEFLKFEDHYRYRNSFNYAHLELSVGSHYLSGHDKCIIYQPTDKSLGIHVENLRVKASALLYLVERCTGVAYLNITRQFESATGDIFFSKSDISCDKECESSLRDALGVILTAESVSRVNSFYSKVPSTQIYRNIDIKETNVLNNQGSGINNKWQRIR